MNTWRYVITTKQHIQYVNTGHCRIAADEHRWMWRSPVPDESKHGVRSGQRVVCTYFLLWWLNKINFSSRSTWYWLLPASVVVVSYSIHFHCFTESSSLCSQEPPLDPIPSHKSRHWNLSRDTLLYKRLRHAPLSLCSLCSAGMLASSYE
jgi:hypothetical protein